MCIFDLAGAFPRIVLRRGRDRVRIQQRWLQPRLLHLLDNHDIIFLYTTLRKYFPKYIFSILLFPLPPMRNNARTLLACGHTRYGSKVQKGLEHNTKQVGGKAFKTVTVAIHTPNAYRTYLKHIIQPDDNYVRLSLKYHVEVDDIKRVRHSLPLRVLIYLCTYECCVRVRVNIFFFFI